MLKYLNLSDFIGLVLSIFIICWSLFNDKALIVVGTLLLINNICNLINKRKQSKEESASAKLNF